MCDGLGRQFTYACPNMTLFHQRMLICDHWYMVNCSMSEQGFKANLLIGQKEKKFVDDSDEIYAYQRTPRPDLHLPPSAPEFNIIYRRGKAYASASSSNLVGIDVDNSKGGTEEPNYFVPSRWSTELAKTTTNKPNERRKSPYKPFSGTFSYTRTRTTEAPDKNELEETKAPEEVRVNFQSNYKGTTPQYPKVVDFVTPIPPGEDIGLLPPKEQAAKPDEVHVNFASKFKGTTPQYPKVVDFVTPLPPGEEIGLLPPKEQEKVKINFASNYKGTTPQYPTVVDFVTPLPPGEEIGLLPPKDTQAKPQVNFESKYKGTTPQFPKVVDFTTPSPPPEELGLLPPLEAHPEDEVHINFASNFKGTTPQYPKVVDFVTPLPPGEEIGLLPPKSPQPETVNFESNYKGTTPQYPKVVDFVTPLPPGDEIGLLPPKSPLNLQDTIHLEPPSKFYEPPPFDPNYKNRDRLESTTKRAPASTTTNGEQRWKDLRRIFLIPDYEFPLETGSRIGYDGRLSSFQADAIDMKSKK